MGRRGYIIFILKPVTEARNGVISDQQKTARKTRWSNFRKP